MLKGGLSLFREVKGGYSAKESKEKAFKVERITKPQRTTDHVQEPLEWQVSECVGTQSVRGEMKEKRLGRQAEACVTDKWVCGQWEIIKEFWDFYAGKMS